MDVSAVMSEPSPRSKTLQFASIPARWEIAQLTDEDISTLDSAEMWNILATHLPPELLPSDPDSNGLSHHFRLRQLVRIARRTCRLQGY